MPDKVPVQAEVGETAEVRIPIRRRTRLTRTSTWPVCARESKQPKEKLVEIEARIATLV